MALKSKTIGDRNREIIQTISNKEFFAMILSSNHNGIIADKMRKAAKEKIQK